MLLAQTWPINPQEGGNKMWPSILHGRQSSPAFILASILLFLGLQACSTNTGTGSDALVAVDETVESSEESVTGTIPVGSRLKTTANVNFRSGPSTGYSVLRVLAKGAEVETADATPSNNFYKVRHNGTTGWVHGNYLMFVSTPSGGTSGVNGTLEAGTVLEVVADLNFRSGPSTSYKVLSVLSGGTQVTTTGAEPQNRYYQIDYQGKVGWAHGGYMKVVGDSTSNPPPATDKISVAIDRAKAGVGFSYWWGHARWLPSGPTSTTAGSCSGNCPSCSHSGSYGADCSGYVGKIWQVPSTNTDLTHDWHPYSTKSFMGSSSLWSVVSRSNLQKADALVYNDGSSGHIILYESGDGWGSMWAYECKGCAAGCVRNLRTTASSYKGIRRSGF
jgi:uncharacterized protein YraI